MPGTLVVDTGANVWRSIRFDLRVRHGLRRWRQPAALRADDLRRPQPLPAASSARWRAKRLTAVTSVAASRSSLPISASARAMISLDTAAADLVGALSETETVLIRASSVSSIPRDCAARRDRTRDGRPPARLRSPSAFPPLPLPARRDRVRRLLMPQPAPKAPAS